MGRAFEVRKQRKMKRWGHIAVQFTKLTKEITIAAKTGGGNPDSNIRLRAAIQNAKAAMMPKDKVENAIKKGTGEVDINYEEIVYEGYGLHGVAILVETATDNTNRTVANVRSYFTKYNGSLGKTGSLSFIFERRSMFEVEDKDLDADEFEFELIDFGLQELYKTDDGKICIEGDFTSFGEIHKFLDSREITIAKSKVEYIPLSTVSLNEEQTEEVMKLIHRLEDDDDVLSVYHNIEE